MYRKSSLLNGLRIVTHDMKERESVGIGFWVGVGGRYEDDTIKGAAHFLEHILFKGSEKYSCTAIKEEIEGVGGSLNAFTSEELTCYYAKIPARYEKKTFDILADMVFHPKISPKDVERERGVICEEIKMYHDLPQYYVLELLDELLWPNHPLGKSLAGTIDSVTRMDHKALRQLHTRLYTPERVVLAACGNVSHSELLELAQHKLDKIPAGQAMTYLPAKDAQSAPRFKFFRKDTEQMHLALGMPAYHDDHKDRYILNLLHILLGGNMSSRLFNEVREKRGLAYSISTSAKALHDTGMFMVRAGVDNTKLVQAMDVILKELKKIRLKGVGEDEFARARDFYKGQVVLGLEDTLDHMLWVGESLVVRNRLRTVEEILQKISAIKREDVQRVAREILAAKRYNLAIVGPTTDEQEKTLAGMLEA